MCRSARSVGDGTATSPKGSPVDRSHADQVREAVVSATTSGRVTEPANCSLMNAAMSSRSPPRSLSSIIWVPEYDNISCWYCRAEYVWFQSHWRTPTSWKRPSSSKTCRIAGLTASRVGAGGPLFSEALGADIDNLDVTRGHRTLFIHRKGNKTATIPLSPRTARALDLYIGERETGPLFLNHDGTRRLDRHASARIVRRLAKQAGIDKRISPHSLRHSFITAALDAGVPLRDVQEAASHADPRTTMRYDRGRGSFDRHPTDIVSTFVAGASR